MTSIVPLEILLAGSLIVLAILTKHFLTRIKVPALIGYLLLGFILRLADEQGQFLSRDVLGVFEFLASIGLIILLFRVGLHSNLAGLIRQLRHASVIWVGNVLFSGVLGFLAARYLFKLGLIPSLFVGTALTATSVGVAIAAWQEQRALDSENGDLLIDVAEMDDISSVMFMTLLLAITPILRGAPELTLSQALSATAIDILLKVFVFGALCCLFSQFAEERVMTFFRKIRPAPDPMLLVVGTGFIIAALAGWLGFSLAVGALFAGLVFSRDPRSIKVEASFGALFELFTPFFFIDIGLRIDPHSLATATHLGLGLLAVAIVGKLLGTGVPTLWVSGWTSAVLLSISMVPRAEIAMVIMQYGRTLGDWAVPQPVFSSMVLVSAATCLLTPGLLRPLLGRWPQGKEITECRSIS